MTESENQRTARPNSSRVFLKYLPLSVPDRKTQLVFWPVAVAGLLLDLWTKHAVFNWLSNRGPFQVIDGFLQLVMAENIGAAFGIAAGQKTLLIAVSAIALVVIFVLFFSNQLKSRLVQVAFGLFTAGVCGNLYDRIFNDGRVRDFIDVVYWPGKHWPAFNVADSMLCISVGLLIISSFRDHKHNT